MSLIFVSTKNHIGCDARHLQAFFDLVIVPMADKVDFDVELIEMDKDVSDYISVDENLGSHLNDVYSLFIGASKDNKYLAEIKDELTKAFKADKRFSKN